ncbi:MAG TPA: hypothetical protein GXZ45_12840 [Propionibacterium sp.]|nr:hypothetical protein [Propionibacterium sp.]
MSDQFNETNDHTQPEGEFVEEFEVKADEPHLAAGEKFTPEQLGDAVIKFATETAYAAAGVANVLAEKAKVFYEAQRKEIEAKAPEGVDPNFRQFVDTMPDQFKGFIDEATKAFHDMAERGRTTVADFQHQVQAARDAAKDARTETDPFDLKDDASATAEAADAVAPEDAQDVVTDAYPGEAKDEPRQW